MIQYFILIHYLQLKSLHKQNSEASKYYHHYARMYRKQQQQLSDSSKETERINA